MPSSYTSSLRLTLPQTGDLTGSWGGVVNSGVTSLVDQAVAGTANITMTTDTNYTLSSSNGSSDEARCMFINVAGVHTVTTDVICPAVSKLFVVTNNTVGDQSIVFKTAAGTGVTIPNGTRATVYCDGTNVTAVSMYGTTDTAVSYLTGSLALTSLDAGITTIADTTGFSGYSALVTSSFQNTTVGMYGTAAAGTTAGVNNASLGILSFSLASAGMIRTDFAGAPLYFATNSGLRMKILDAGELDLYAGAAGAQINLYNVGNATVGGYLDVSASNTVRLWTGANNSTVQVGQIGAGTTGGKIQFVTENTEKVRITADGSVGIGTSSPSEKLVVAGNAYLSNIVAGGGVFTLIYNGSSAANSYSQFALWNNNGFNTISVDITFYSSSGAHSGAAANELRIRNGANSPTTFYTSNTERMRITGAGNVGIGTISPGQKLSVAGTIESTTGGFKLPDGYVVSSSKAVAKAWVNITIPFGGYSSATYEYFGTSLPTWTTVGTDRYIITFSNAFANANYACEITITPTVFSVGGSSGAVQGIAVVSKTTTTFEFTTSSVTTGGNINTPSLYSGNITISLVFFGA